MTTFINDELEIPSDEYGEKVFYAEQIKTKYYDKIPDNC